MKHVALLAPVVLLAGCPHKQPENQWVPAGVQQWAPPPQVVEYTRVNVAGPFHLPDVRLRDEWSGPVLEGDHLLYDVVTTDITDDAAPEWLETTRHVFGADGYGYLGTLDEEGNLEAWDPVEFVLPANPQVGDAWEGTHTKGEYVSERSCEILASEYCDGGLVSVCDSHRGGGRIILRDHFCPDIGWAGFEAMVVAGDRPPIRMWSEKVVRDGVALPDPEPVEYDPIEDSGIDFSHVEKAAEKLDEEQPEMEEGSPEEQP